MKTLVYGSLLLVGLQLLTGAKALVCPNSIVCIHDNDATELCAEVTDSGINCPAGSHVDPSLGTVVPICATGNVACVHQNDDTTFCYPGYICPAGSTQIGPVNLPKCSDNKQMCVYGSMYGCFDYACPSGMTPVGSIDCTIPPQTCASSEKLCVYDIGNAFACQSSGNDCWPGTHEWKSCKPRIDFASNSIIFPNGHFIKCLKELTKRANGNVFCHLPVLDDSSFPVSYGTSKLLALISCTNDDGSANYLQPLANELGFSSYTASSSLEDLLLFPQSFVSAVLSTRSSRPDRRVFLPEYCIVGGEFVFWTDPRCKFTLFNANCFVNSFEFVL